MSEWPTLQTWMNWFTPERVAAGMRAALVLFGGWVLVRVAVRITGRVVGARIDPQRAQIARGLVRSILGALVVLMALDQVGVHLGVLMGAAGVLSVAVGFASQTAASNLISGLFLTLERPFKVGDVLRLNDGLSGAILSVDMLSIKLRTFDNLLVRVPNEDLIKTRFTNLSHFPIRRVDLQIGVAYKEDLERVRSILDRIADANPLCMTEPEPLFLFQGYGDSALLFQYSVWGERSRYVELRNSMYQEIKQSFDDEGIEIPFPHVSIYSGSVTEPIPLRIVDSPDHPKDS